MNTTEQGEPQGPVTVQMPEGGAYHVTVFPIRVRTGIVDSNVAYAMDIAVTTGMWVYIRGYIVKKSYF